MNVVLPAPFSPTSARLCPLGTKTSTPRSAHLSASPPPAASPPGYLKPTPSNRIPSSARTTATGPIAFARAPCRDREVVEQVRHVQRVLVHPAQRRQHRLEALLPLPERDQVQRHVAQRQAPAHRRGDDQRVAAVEHDRAEQRQRVAPDHAPHRQAAIVGEERLGQAPVAAEQQRRRGRTASPPWRARRWRARTRGRSAGASRASASCAAGTPRPRSGPRR